MTQKWKYVSHSNEYEWTTHIIFMSENINTMMENHILHCPIIGSYLSKNTLDTDTQRIYYNFAYQSLLGLW